MPGMYKWILYFIVSSYLAMIRDVITTKPIQMTKLERKTFLDDYTCLTQDLVFSTSVKNALRCVFLCLGNETCTTVFYNHLEGKCRGCGAYYSVSSLPLQSPGFIHYQKAQISCEDGWSNFMDSCYMLSPASDFFEGADFCEGNGAHPVYVETSEENDFLKTFLATDPLTIAWYMGMTDSESSGVWKYYKTHILVEFLDFHISQPDDNGSNSQQCSLIVSPNVGYSYQWADHHCIDAFPTICEKALNR